MKVQWTKAQQQAINSLDGTLLVSAAAGSGKTAVLVERVINRLTNEEKPCDANKLLIVTFTRAATSEMRERIDKAISQKLKQEPNNTHLLRQKMLLPSTNICTIDSFCNDLVKENFYKLGINPDFKIISESERTMLALNTANEIIEELYTEDSKEFKELVEFLFKGRDDSELANSIISLYDYSQAYAFPQTWLNDSLKLYDDNTDLKDNKFLQVLFDYVSSACNYFISKYDNSMNLIKQDEVLNDKYLGTFKIESDVLKSIKQTSIQHDWDKLYELCSKPIWGRIPSTPKGYKSEIKTIVSDSRKDIKDKFNKKILPIMCCNSNEIIDDMNYLKPIVQKLFDTVSLFSKRFMNKKQEENSLDFNDITHLAINLLAEEKDGQVIRTPLAKELSEKYEEILIDEYQDTNKAQDILFSSISKDFNNMFMVGDVKQSIYRFRKAMPEIFITKKNTFNKFDGNNYPGVINLDKNYRSRKGVVDYINFVFSQIMSNDVGEVVYDESEELKFGASYNEKETPDTEIHILDTDNFDGNKIQLEAKHIAKTISNLIEDGATVQNKDGTTRNATYKDFCILLRSTKDRAQIYTKELLAQGIPAFGDNAGGFFDTYEIQVIISLLKVLDNPTNDIPLLSVLMSPIFGFTPDELAKIRLIDKNTSLYNCALKSANSGNDECKEFIDKITILRKFAAALPVCELIRKIYNETDYICLALAMENGSRRQANLNLLLDFANSFDKDKANGLSSFIRYIDNMSEKSIEIQSANDTSPNDNVVKIMSIHKSKGLEFPYCIIANCSKQFNTMSTRSNMILHPSLGVGMTRRNSKNMHEFETAMHLATKIAVEQDELSEEMRVLYVAMTRAREKLICVMTYDKLENKIKSFSNNITEETQIPSFAIKNCSSFGDWLISASIRHPDAISLRNSTIDYDLCSLKSDSTAKFKIYNEELEEIDLKPTTLCSPDFELLNEIKEKSEFEYKYNELKIIPTKCAASHREVNNLNTEYFASYKPPFLNKSGLTPAQRGTALHKFMQYAIYENAKTNSKEELDRLLKYEFITQEEYEVINLEKIDKFFCSNLYDRISKSNEVMREKKFAINVSANDINDNLSSTYDDEQVLIQGIADCAFVEDNKLVIVDYKTDRVKSEESLIENYSDQLKTYCKALKLCTGLEIKEALLYSFELSKTVKIV